MPTKQLIALAIMCATLWGVVIYVAIRDEQLAFKAGFYLGFSIIATALAGRSILRR